MPLPRHTRYQGADAGGRSTISGCSMTMDPSIASSPDTTCRFAPVTTIAKGTPAPSTSRWHLLPFGEIVSHRFQRQGALVIQPSALNQGPVYAADFIAYSPARLARGPETPLVHPTTGNTGISSLTRQTKWAGPSIVYRY
jgi:hypothetical protein